mgnify:CR=1 FL=1|tara:strand:+ start:9478 stop:10023 length:546 start_codon:yes stop_codon:yes gene_type:complete
MFNNQQLIVEMPRLEKFALRLTRSQHDANDLVQSTLLRAMEKKHLFQEGTDLFKWTSKMMYNLFVSAYRRKVKFETQYDPESYLEKQSIEAPQDTQIELMKVKEAMTQLSSEHREVIALVCIQGMSYQDVSSSLNIPVGTVRSRLSRARDQLQSALDAPTAKETFSMPPASKQKYEHRMAA